MNWNDWKRLEEPESDDDDNDERITLEDAKGFAIVIGVLILFALAVAVTGIDLT
ncbi:MAG: hypothetical protein OXF88_06150 [Rhodobacteraceae bacterium]|nr:hypothetical protein [Paracoccaceae bacterium]MCY4139232.1 hypothetical protein [Paracoccaceae bacterium]